MITCWCRIAVSVVVAAVPSLCFAWGGIGHQAVAIIAEDHLTPAAKAGIRELIGDTDISDAEVCSWADEIKRDQRATAPLHYVDIPTNAEMFDPTRDGKGGNNVIDAIAKQTKLLADKSTPKEQRAEA